MRRLGMAAVELLLHGTDAHAVTRHPPERGSGARLADRVSAPLAGRGPDDATGVVVGREAQAVGGVLIQAQAEVRADPAHPGRMVVIDPAAELVVAKRLRKGLGHARALAALNALHDCHEAAVGALVTRHGCIVCSR